MADTLPARPRSSLSPRIYLCDLCGREFLDYNQMRKHRLECRRERNLRVMAREVDYAKSWRLIYCQCDKCGQRWGPCRLPEFRRVCLSCGGNLVVLDGAAWSSGNFLGRR